jgi:GNAT superfamily N-acetyltransferase
VGQHTVRKLAAADVASLVSDLAEILLDAVEGGASVGFMAGMSRADAEAFWLGVAEDVERRARLLFGAFDDSNRLVGTAQLVLSMPPNQQHRAEVAKMLVHRRARRRGVARALLSSLEAEARALGRRVLTLDTLSGSDAERLYASSDYVSAGSIPDYALRPNGTAAATTLFFKQLR